MKRSFLPVVAVAALVASSAFAQSPRAIANGCLVASLGHDAPLPAQQLLKEAQRKAGKQKQTVFMSFHASWCGWCKRLDAFMNLPDVKPIIQKHMQVVWIDVLEHGDKKSLENPGGDKVLTDFNATKQGLPSFYILSPKGKLLASSVVEKSGNIGYPGAPEEIAHFLSMMKTAGVTDSESAILKARLDAIAATLK